jgi:hypothetical protein
MVNRRLSIGQVDPFRAGPSPAVAAQIEAQQERRKRPEPGSVTPADVALAHRLGCPEAEGRRADHPYRKAIGIEAYVATGTGKYDRATGEYSAAPQKGVVRCIECAAQTTVPAEDIPAIQRYLITVSAIEEGTNGN